MNDVVIVSAVCTPIGKIRGAPSSIHEMHRQAAEGQKMRFGLATLCVGVGQGEATLVERFS